MKKLLLTTSLVITACFVHVGIASADWTAEYWNLGGPTSEPAVPGVAANYTTTVSGNQVIDLNWLEDSPDPSINSNGFYAKYSQTINFSAGNYVFAAYADDGVRISVDGNVVVNSWTDQGATIGRYSQAVSLAAGNHDVVVEYYENSGGARIRFWYDAYPYTGTGTNSDPYVVSNCTGVQLIGGSQNNTYTGREFQKFVLTSDIDCSATATWNSNGTGGYFGFMPFEYFYGVIDGQYHAIQGLTINNSARGYVGLATYLYGAFVNLELENSSVTGGNYTGTFAGLAASSGALLGVSTNGTVTSTGNTGGLVGIFDGSTSTLVEGSSFTGTVTTSAGNAGGIGGEQSFYGPVVNNSYVNGTITATNYAGGVFGYSFGNCGASTITNSYVTGSISGNIAGGLIGAISNKTCNTTVIGNSFVAASLSGSDTGAIFGRKSNASATTSGNYFDQTATGTSQVVGSISTGFLSDDTVAVNTDGSTPSYFKNNTTNPPVNNWDFSSIWITSTDYPLHRSIVFNAPSAPANLDVQNNGLSISASWDQPVDTGNLTILQYQVQFKVSTATWENYEYDTTLSELSYNFGTSYSNYEGSYDVRVRAKNAYGWSDWTETSITLGEAPVHTISSCSELQAMDDEPGTFADTFTLTQDIDCSGVDFLPLGYDNWDDDFRGTFDGNGHTISNLTINREDDWGVGLFAYTDEATIKNLTLQSPNVLGQGSVGVIAGETYRITVENVTVTNGAVAGTYTVGGLIGYTYMGSLTSNAFQGQITATGSGDVLGGLTGYASIDEDTGTMTISENTFNGTFENVSGTYNIGGIIGYLDLYNYTGNAADVIVSKNKSNATFTSDSDTQGGIIGYMYSYVDGTDGELNVTIDQNQFSGTIESTGVSIGGIIGLADIYQYNTSISTNTFSNNVFIGTVRGSDEVGGLMGTFYTDYSTSENLSAVFEKSYSAGTVDGDSNTGGAFGRISGSKMTIQDIFSVSSVGYSGESPATDHIGGFAGAVATSGVTLSNNWQDADLTGQEYCYVSDDGNPTATESGVCETVSGSDSLWKAANASSNAPSDSWNFSSIWGTTADGYPVLQAFADAYTEAPILSAPVAGNYVRTSPMTITFSLPEDMFPGSLSLTFIPTEGDSITLSLRDAMSGQDNTFTITPSGGIGAVTEVTSTTSDSIPLGTYTVRIAYQDIDGNPVATDSVTGVVITNPVTTQSSGGSSSGSYGPGFAWSGNSNQTNNVTPSSEPVKLTRNLKQGVKGNDVKTLQKLLNKKGFVVAKSGAGSPGFENTNFGALTKKAVIKFQKANGLKADGVVGPKTWALLNT